MIRLGNKALAAKDFLSTVTTVQKNTALEKISAALRENSQTIIEENKTDIENGKKAGLGSGLLDRLMHNDERICYIASSVHEVAAMPDPCVRILDEIQRPNGLKIQKVS
ncbi:MAG: gamma-glutamyl-phosphate reductase, partial [Clostridiales bacterium]|nr:gamma-glutamyl-phosphate reductase [Clostridiales bacterium]